MEEAVLRDSVLLHLTDQGPDLGTSPTLALSQFQTRKAEWIKDLSSLFTLHLSKSCEPPGPQMSFSKELKTKPRISLNKTLRKDLASSEAQLCETSSYLDRMVPSAIQSSKLMFGGFASEMIPSIH